MREDLKRGDAESAEGMLGQELRVLSASAFLSLTNLLILLDEPAASALPLTMGPRFHALKVLDDLRGVFVGEGSEDSVQHVAQLASVDEEQFVCPVPQRGGSSASLLFRFGQEPDAGRYLCIGKELAESEDLKRGDGESAEEMRGQELCVLSASAFLFTTRRIMMLP